MSKDEKKRGEESIVKKYHDEWRKKLNDDKYINEVISICDYLVKEKDKDKDKSTRKCWVPQFKQDIATSNKDQEATTIPHNTACIVKNLKRTCKTILGMDVSITTKELEKNVKFWTDIYFCFRKGLSKLNRSLFDKMQFEGYSVDGSIKPIIDKLNEHLERNFEPEEISSINDFNIRINNDLNLCLKALNKTLEALNMPKETLNIFLKQIDKKINEIRKNSKTTHITIDREHLFIYLKNVAEIKTRKQKLKIATKLSESIGTKFDLKKTGSAIKEFFEISNKLQENIGNNNQDFEHIYKSVKSFLEHDNNLQILVNKVQDSLKTQLQNSTDNHQINSSYTKNFTDKFLAFIELLSQSNYNRLLKAESTKTNIIYLLYSYTAFILAYGEESCGYEDANPYKSEIRQASNKRKRNFEHIAEDLPKDKTTQLPTDIMRLFYNILCIYEIFENINEGCFTELTNIKNYFNIEQNINDATANLLLYHNLHHDITFKLKKTDNEILFKDNSLLYDQTKNKLIYINNPIKDLITSYFSIKDNSFYIELTLRKEFSNYINSNEYKNQSLREEENNKNLIEFANKQGLPTHSRQIQCHDFNCGDKFAERNVPQLNFTLENIYCFVFVDRIDVKIKNIESSFVYVFYGINTEGNKELLHIQAFSDDKSKLADILNSIKDRGVNDILFLCVNEVSYDLENSIHSIFPKTVVQCSIPHLIINSTEFIPSKELKKDFCADCEKVYGAVNLKSAETACESLKNKWVKDHPLAVKIWENNFEHIHQLYNYPAEIRKVTCTTVNALKSLNSYLLKITANKLFENTKAVVNTLYRSELARIWRKTKIPYWERVLTQLSCMDETRNRIVKYESSVK
ncbi:transposase [Succinimonas amylolytica]|uniref:transposase n=1 Tax=Succinimonas amylolytica TaxID=83769 RepID=UPI0003764702|nr:transposase [Succinimonas amylolytica]